ncbi:MAG: hypothetical protein KDI83_10025 [Gammaproteobacteria bacterium]|nr:hypothetical protein [Gammaproteobacteria bacterium]
MPTDEQQLYRFVVWTVLTTPTHSYHWSHISERPDIGSAAVRMKVE